MIEWFLGMILGMLLGAFAATVWASKDRLSREDVEVNAENVVLRRLLRRRSEI